MATNNYSACLEHILKWEGGYVDHPRDPGGATNHGITRATLAAHRGRAVSKQDVRELTIAEAGEIYRPGYWNKVKGDHLPDGMDLVAFDGGVNSGPSRGGRWLQKGLGVAADGVIGPVTLDAALGAPGVSVIQRACAARMGFLQKLGTWSTFGRGWARRVADTEATAVAMYSRSQHIVANEYVRADKAKRTQTTGAATSVAGGAGSAGVLDMPEWALGGVIAVAVFLALFMALKASHHARRAAAYRAKSVEMNNG